MSCKHRPVIDKIHPDMGSFPSSWTCDDCNTTVAITWVPYLHPDLPEEPKEKCVTWCNPKCLVTPCPCSCHKVQNVQSIKHCSGCPCHKDTPKSAAQDFVDGHTENLENAFKAMQSVAPKPEGRVCSVCGHGGEGHITRFNDDGTVSLCVDKLPHKPKEPECEHKWKLNGWQRDKEKEWECVYCPEKKWLPEEKEPRPGKPEGCDEGQKFFKPELYCCKKDRQRWVEVVDILQAIVESKHPILKKDIESLRKLL